MAVVMITQRGAMSIKRMVIWIIGVIIGLALLTGLAILIGVQTNGAGTLNRVDRVLNGFTSVSESEPISFGDHPQQRLFVLSDGGQADTGNHAKASTKPLPVIIFIHGGSWYHGDPEYYGFVGRTLAPKGHIVVNAGYRLGDDGKYPAMLEDAASAVKWVHDNIADYGGDPEQIVLAGHSAGAYNAVMVALEPRWLERADLSEQAIKGVIGLAGPYDFLPFTSDGAKRAFGDEEDPSITQPVNFVRSDAPPMLLMTGDADTTVRPRNTQALAEALREQGGRVATHVYPEVSHARIIMNLAKPWGGSSDLADRISTFVSENSATNSAESPSEEAAENDSASAPVQAESR
ncbi:alpha/beta hydrolase [Erythrobacter sp. W53]|uniref:alpha/beta hydrolase n=1 Tax=Erythrobacter sp. W53 TaxID=3425947 RepID=UPI003D769938